MTPRAPLKRPLISGPISSPTGPAKNFLKRCLHDPLRRQGVGIGIVLLKLRPRIVTSPPALVLRPATKPVHKLVRAARLLPLLRDAVTTGRHARERADHILLP